MGADKKAGGDIMEKIKRWFKRKMHEFLLFLEYPIEYIVEFGDKFKQQSLGQKALTILKLLVTIFLCVILSELVVFVILCGAVFVGNSFEYDDEYI